MKGFEYMGKKYAWHNNELYRLPHKSGRNHYGICKCKKWGDKGYFLGSSRKSFNQLEEMTVDVEPYEFDRGNEHTPF